MISIITTFFNSEKYLLDNIKSVQSIRHQDKIEHILVDDGSNDLSLQIAKLNINDRATLLTPGRIGRAKALNLAINHSSYDLICVLDSDDLINPDWIDLFIENIDTKIRDELQNKVFFSNVKLIDEDIHDIVSSETAVLSSGKPFKNFWIFLYNPIPHSGAIFSKTIANSSKIYSENLKSKFDWDLWFRAIKSGNNIIYFNITGAYKRIHKQQFFERSSFISYFFRGIILQLRWSYRLNKFMLFPVILFCILRLLWRLFPFRLKLRNFCH